MDVWKGQTATAQVIGKKVLILEHHVLTKATYELRSDNKVAGN